LARDTVTAFVIDPKDPDVLYASTENAGVYKSIDGGLSWRPALYGLTDIHVESLLVDGQDTQNVYAGTPSGIYKTEDGGENWSRIGEGRHVLIDPGNNAHLYARDDDNIYESTDEGNNWKSVYSAPAGCSGKTHSWAIDSWAIHPTDGNRLYLGGGDECERGIYQSNDGGRTWTLIQKVENPTWFEIAPQLGSLDPIDSLAVWLEEGNLRVVYGHAWEARDSAGFVYYRCWQPFLPFLCRSRPNGEQTVRLGKPDVWADVDVTARDSGESYLADVAVITISPHDPNTIYVAREGIAVTKDGGLTWTKLNNGLGNTILHLAAGLGNESALFLMPGKCKGELTDQKHDITQSLYLSTNGGSTWDFVTETGCRLIMDADGSTVYRLSTNYRGGGDGMGWLWRSQDGGRSWQRILIPGLIETVVAHASQTGHLYAFAQDPFYERTINPDFQPKWYFDSGDYGDTWNEQESPASTNLCYGSTLQFIDAYRPITIDPSDGNHVFVIEDGKLLESHDSCDTTAPFASAPNAGMNSIAFDPYQSDTLYAGTDSGAYVSFDGGKTWIEINDGLLGATVVYSIVVDKDSNVYAATPYGIFKMEEE